MFDTFYIVCALVAALSLPALLALDCIIDALKGA